MKLFISGFLAIISIVGAVKDNELPDMLKRCKLDSTFNACMKDAITDAIPYVIEHAKELGLPEMRPFRIKKMVFESNPNSPVNMRQEFTNVEMSDFMQNSYITDVKFDRQKKIYEFSMIMPTLHFESDYTLNGKVLILPIQGNGRNSVKFENLQLHYKLTFEEVMKNGDVHFHFTSVEATLKPEKMELHFENLFNGDKALGESTNLFLNENWKDIWNEIEPNYARYFSGICLKFINKFYGQRPIKNIFLL